MKNVYIAVGVVIAFALLTLANACMYKHQEDMRKIDFAISSCNESFQYNTDAWVLVNAIKSDIQDKNILIKCDKALELIGRGKDSIVRAKESIGEVR